MSGEIIALLTTLCWSIGIFPFTEAAKRFGSSTLNQYRLLLAWLILFAILVMFYGISVVKLFTLPHLNNYLYLGLSGIVGFTIGDFFTFNSFKMLGPKLSSLYTTFAPGASLLVGYLVLNEKINGIGVCGIFVTVAGVIWLTRSKSDKSESVKAGFERSLKGALFGIAGALCQGTGLVLSKLGMQNIQGEHLLTMHAVWIRLMFAFAGAFVFSIIKGKFKENARSIFQNQNNGLPYLMAGTLFGPVVGVTLSLVAIQSIPVAAAQTIFALLPIVVLPLNYFYYGEKITAQALLACLIAVVGVMILIWRDRLLQWI